MQVRFLWRKRRWRFLIGALCLLCSLLWGQFSVEAQGVTPVQAQVAAESTPVVLNAVQKVFEVVLSSVEVVKLPLGIAEAALSPLPGLSFANGMKSIYNGIKVPFEIVGAVLQLPISTIQNVAGQLLSKRTPVVSSGAYGC